MRYSSLAPYAPPRRGDRKEVCHHESSSSPSRTPRRTALSVSSSRFRSRHFQRNRGPRLYPGHQLARRLLLHRRSLRRGGGDRAHPQHAFRDHAGRRHASPLPRLCSACSLASGCIAAGYLINQFNRNPIPSQPAATLANPRAETKIGVAVRLHGYEYLPESADSSSSSFQRVSALHEHRHEPEEDQPAVAAAGLISR